MTEAVVDVSVLVKWFVPEPGAAEAGWLRGEFEHGRLALRVPPLAFLELLNVAARRWQSPPSALQDFVATIEGFRFDVREPKLASVAAWAGRGLTAYDATYVALAEESGRPLITADREILAAAPEIAQPLVP